MVELFSPEMSARVCRYRNCSDAGSLDRILAASAGYRRRLLLAFGVDHLGASAALGLGLTGHGADHGLIQIDVAGFDVGRTS